MASSPAAYLSRKPRVLVVAGARVTIPYAPAAAWLEHLEAPTNVAYLMADPESQDRIEEALLEIPGASTSLTHQSTELLKAVTGRPRWWEGVRLALAGADPDVMGELILAGLDPWQRTIGEWSAAVYSLAVRNLDAIEREKFRMRLSFPPAGFAHQWNDGEDFDAMVAGMRDMPGVSSGR